MRWRLPEKMFAQDQLEQLRPFPEVSRDELEIPVLLTSHARADRYP